MMTTDDYCRRRPGVFPFALLAFAAGLMLAGCDTVKQAIGLENAPPDEFAVETQAPLSIPPDFALRPPKPGAPRPQALTSEAAARRLLAKATPGKPLAAGSGRLPNLVAGEAPNSNDEVTPQSLSQKLLSFNGSGGVTIEKRKTEDLKDIY